MVVKENFKNFCSLQDKDNNFLFQFASDLLDEVYGQTLPSMNGPFFISFCFSTGKAGCTPRCSELHPLLFCLLLIPSLPVAFLDPGIPLRTSASLLSNPPF